ncbi:VOC family protein [Eoetvoesiella caeni]|uniref:Catechol 2,3-dioxygenase-like lactoylglutathione lyase family enzyme n=1 Tax=Eoetvoesiella caeni TaxID=645616 RepID=A0A366H5P8_9BURK|nr:VOC family protein [Eoetvoesiella caeni]MCI2810475.1 VOC family protein [Eoetvoesiella caeni]NYT54853.1 VOC family protein [Eoetvoesiella caeni]RBP36768.1 catechol 2,3-dioxygenase-like lactoylglutathione lyase family enzyme [Eoetvoesiella caeni]
MSARLNHTIVWCRGKRKSAAFMADILGLAEPVPFGPMLVVQLDNGVSLDFYETNNAIASQHYAFLISEEDFDRVFSRICDRKIQYWSDPGQHHAGKINREDGGRGLYFEDPDGHLLEVITKPYGG